jgi:hypothetical protein
MGDLKDTAVFPQRNFSRIVLENHIREQKETKETRWRGEVAKTRESSVIQTSQDTQSSALRRGKNPMTGFQIQTPASTIFCSRILASSPSGHPISLGGPEAGAGDVASARNVARV